MIGLAGGGVARHSAATMPNDDVFKFISRSEEDTATLARALGPLLRPGDTVLLEGPIGAGKSFFARAVIQARLAAAGLWEEVPSPTFTLVQTYDDGVCEIWHADLYRLKGPTDIAELGLEDAFAQDICIVEWPDRLGEHAPPGALSLTFVPTDAPDGRIITASGHPDVWFDRLQYLREAQGA